MIIPCQEKITSKGKKGQRQRIHLDKPRLTIRGKRSQHRCLQMLRGRYAANKLSIRRKHPAEHEGKPKKKNGRHLAVSLQ